METTNSYGLSIFNLILVSFATVFGIVSVSSWSYYENYIYNAPWSFAQVSTELLGIQATLGVAMGLRSAVSFAIVGDSTAIATIDVWSACASDSGSPAVIISLCTECRDAGARVVASGCLGIISALLMFLCLALACVPGIKNLANARIFKFRIATLLGLVACICFLVGFVSYQSCFSTLKTYYSAILSTYGSIKMGVGQGLSLGAFLFLFFAVIIDRTNNVLVETPLAAAGEKRFAPNAPGQASWMSE